MVTTTDLKNPVPLSVQFTDGPMLRALVEAIGVPSAFAAAALETTVQAFGGAAAAPAGKGVRHGMAGDAASVAAAKKMRIGRCMANTFAACMSRLILRKTTRKPRSR